MFLITVENVRENIRFITPESVRGYIQRHNKSQNWLATRAGVSSTTLNYWMTGRTHPTERTRLRIAVAMGIADPSVLEDVVPERAMRAKRNGVKA